jgi:hypothetical protein
MESTVEKYQDSLTAASKKLFYVRKQRDKTIEYRSAPWWSMELTLMRKKINPMRRLLYRRTKRDHNLREARKQQYQLKKRKYTATLRKSKMLSWKQYCNETTSNPWNAAYKLATGNIKNAALSQPQERQTEQSQRTWQKRHAT